MTRLQLHEILCDILGSRNCYFTPPASLKLKYPCIKYDLDGYDSAYSDNIRYKINKRYTLTLLDFNPDSKIGIRLLEDKRLIRLSSDPVYVMDGLYHYTYTLFL